MKDKVDIKENEILKLSSEILNCLLKDHTTSTDTEQHNIFWATSDYEDLGEAYKYKSQISPHLITGKYGKIIRPRILKDLSCQTARSRDMAEVFTPSWVCNSQNNLIDEAWFGRKGVFNEEVTDGKGNHNWITNRNKIIFPERKCWKKYIAETCMEITCGEAPYITSRYDTTSGKAIPLQNRIGLLDRKLRVINENEDNSTKWLEEAQIAYKNIYAYEWQGDNLLIARENMLATFLDNYLYKFNKMPRLSSIKFIAYIISWNVWQMDGLKGVVPDSCGVRTCISKDLWGNNIEKKIVCKGCEDNEIRYHNGVYCTIKDWGTKDPVTGKGGKRIRYIDLIK